jgi:SAM-dependent methyltransferase
MFESGCEEIKACRACGSLGIDKFLELGTQPLSGVFPKYDEPDPMSGPLNLVKCTSCHLVQLQHNFPLDQMYGDNYGYRSGLNASMVAHLNSKSKRLVSEFEISANSVVLDIGSNDGTLLNSLVGNSFSLFGMDPTIKKFGEFYDSSITKIADFFSAQSFLESSEKVDLVTSISMLYDLQNPLQFTLDIAAILKPEGIWHFEQSYLPSMMNSNAYDTVCHEHLEYYSLASINYLLHKAGLRIIDVEFNSTNGGSFAVSATHIGNKRKVSPLVDWFIQKENSLHLDELDIYHAFKAKVEQHIKLIQSFFELTSKNGIEVFGLGASTKGNVLLNAAKIDSRQMQAIVDVNEFKWDCLTPGSRIPIISEQEFEVRNPKFAFVLPWHFKSNINLRYREYMEHGGKMVYPLPEFEVLGD